LGEDGGKALHVRNPIFAVVVRFANALYSNFKDSAQLLWSAFFDTDFKTGRNVAFPASQSDSDGKNELKLMADSLRISICIPVPARTLKCATLITP
jgi:hypothetical protein